MQKHVRSIDIRTRSRNAQQHICSNAHTTRSHRRYFPHIVRVMSVRACQFSRPWKTPTRFPIVASGPETGRALTGRVKMSRSVTLEKGKNNMIGISIGGGAPFCPVLYIVQVARVRAGLDASRYTPVTFVRVLTHKHTFLHVHACTHMTIDTIVSMI